MNTQATCYVSSHWARIRARDAALDPGFAKHLREISRPTQIAYQILMSRYDGNPMGIECKSDSREGWAVVLPNLTDEGPVKVQYFDADGFSGHYCQSSMTKAVEQMISEGYRTIDEGILDRLVATERWSLGTKRQALRDQMNRGFITWNQMIEQFNLLAAA